MEANATSNKVFIDRILKSANCKGSREQSGVLEAPEQGPKRVWRGVEEDLNRLAPLRNLTTKSCLPIDLPSMWSWYADIAAAWTLRVEGDSYAPSPAAKRKARHWSNIFGGPSRREEHHLTIGSTQGVSTSRDSARAEAMVLSTSGG